MAMLEEENKDVIVLNNFNNTFAADYSNRYPYIKGKKLGILTNKNNTPIQENPSLEPISGSGYLDINNTGNDEYKSFLKESEYVVGSGTTLVTELKKLAVINKEGGKFWRVEENKFVKMTENNIPNPQTNNAGLELSCDQIDYVFDDSTNTITDYNGSDTEIEILSKICGKDVITIGDYAFESSQLTSVIISDSVISIGEEAFNQEHGDGLKVHGPSGGYVKDTWDNNPNDEFDKSGDAEYIGDQ